MRLRSWTSHFVLAGMFSGLVESLLGFPSEWRPMVASVAMNGLLGLALGLCLGVPLFIALRVLPLKGLRARLASLGADLPYNHERLAAVYGAVLSFGLVLALYAQLVYLALARVWIFQDTGFALQFATLFIVALVVVSTTIFFLGKAVLNKLFLRLPRLPAKVAPTVVLTLGLPAIGILATFASSNKALLGDTLSSGLWLVTMLVAVVTSLCLLTLAGTKQRSKLWQLLAPALLLFSMTLTFVVFDSNTSAKLRGGIGCRMGLAIVHRLSDVDRDGFSSLLGGGDCAAFDAKRNPAARDLPGNGTDENCDGNDQVEMQVTALTPFTESLGDLPIKKYNVVWLIIDAVRSDQIGATSKPSKTAPNIDKLAEESLVFDKAYSQSSRTLYSLSSMFSGRNPMGIRWVKSRGYPQAAPELVSIAEMLKTAGYATGLVLPGNVKKYYTGLQQGFSMVASSYLDKDWSKWSREGAPVANVRGLEFMEEAHQRKMPFFLAIHYIEPHVPYLTHGSSYPSFGRSELANYQSEISYVDRQVQTLLDYLRYKDAAWDNTIVIVTSDHGEEFGEHGGKHHGRTCHWESTHVPLIVRIPGVAHKRVHDPVGLIDIVPMLMELTGIPRESTQLQGQSLLVPALAPSSVPANRPLFCATANRGTRNYLQTSVRSGDFFLMKEVWDGVRSLYDTSSDPGEKVDISSLETSGETMRLLESQLRSTSTEDIEAGW